MKCCILSNISAFSSVRFSEIQNTCECNRPYSSLSIKSESSGQTDQRILHKRVKNRMKKNGRECGFGAGLVRQGIG